MNTIMKRTLLNTNISILSATFAFTVLADNPKANMNESPANQSHQSMDGQMHSIKDSRFSEPKMKNAWLEGKLEVALLLNRHLNNFTIDSEVKSGKAILSGTVESKIDSELAEQVALSIDGIETVDNKLTLDPKKAKENREMGKKNTEGSFSQKVDDMTTTAVVKSKLLSNGSTHGLSINVDTSNGVVSLQGDVSAAEEKQLAEKLTGNTDGVIEVKNLLKVSS